MLSHVPTFPQNYGTYGLLLRMSNTLTVQEPLEGYTVGHHSPQRR